jgi:hypothetical protein
MKKLLLLIICLQRVIPAFTQSLDKNIIQCIDSIEKGDTIQFGPKKGYFFYEHIFEYKGSTGSFGDRILNIQQIENDLSSQKYRVKDHLITSKSVWDFFGTGTKQIISFGKGGSIFGITYYADIYRAIESGEIVIEKCQIIKKQ